MKKKYIAFNIAIITVALLLFFGFGISVTRSNLYDEAGRIITEITDVYVNNYTTPQNAVKHTSGDTRVTVIDSTGRVIADSVEIDVSAMENHMNREEILNALADNPKTVIRKSETLGVDMVYYAKKAVTDDGYVFIRTALPIRSAQNYALQTVPYLLMIMAGVITITSIVSMIFGMKLLDPVKKIGENLREVKNGSYKPILPDTGDDELNSVICGINDVSEALQQTLREAESGKQRLDYILNHIMDGIVVLSAADGTISLCNKAASAIFGVTEAEGRGYALLTSDRTWNENVKELLTDGGRMSGELEDDGKIYSYTMSRLENGIAVIVLSDVTAERNSARMRSEFFANASHELKTPLTAIKGFNEMIGMKTTDSNIREMSRKIGKEADRMITLISDMLDLSELESTSELHPETLDAKQIAEEVADTLAPLAAEKNVTLTVNGSGRVKAEKEHLTELIKNLAENGIRYNHSAGTVKITVTESGNKTVISVADDGIGIGDEHQSRIFERFYRVSKSRSRETGGTGLGLAIVKHICSLYSAEISLRSKPGVGTEITVSFSQ